MTMCSVISDQVNLPICYKSRKEGKLENNQGQVFVFSSRRLTLTALTIPSIIFYVEIGADAKFPIKHFPRIL